MVVEQIDINCQLQMLEDQSLTEQPATLRQSSGVRSTNIKAYTFAALSSISIVLMQIVLKQVSKHFPPPLILGVRGSLLFLFNFLYLHYSGTNIHTQDPTLFRAIVKRSLASTVTVIMYLSSVKYIPIGVANALFNTTPIMTFFVQMAYYRKGTFHWFNLLIIVISFIGVILIIQPTVLFGGAPPDNYVFYFVVLVSAFTASFSVIFLHDLRGKTTELIILQHGYFIQTTLSYLLYIFVHSDDTGSMAYLSSLSIPEILKLILFLLLLVTFAFATQFFQAKSVFLCSPALVMPFSYFSVIFGFVIDALIFNVKYNGLMVIGMVMASVGLFSKFIALYFDDNKREKQKYALAKG